jgi:cellulose synthase/poly-beta-1,6-N-acetylglucosamine synthase-like glycosyltransferase
MKIEKIQKINEDAYRLGDYLSYADIIYFILCLTLSMIPSLGEKVWSLNFYLFHLFALLSVGEAFKKVTSFFEKSAERKSEFDYFLEFFAKKAKH